MVPGKSHGNVSFTKEAPLSEEKKKSHFKSKRYQTCHRCVAACKHELGLAPVRSPHYNTSVSQRLFIFTQMSSFNIKLSALRVRFNECHQARSISFRCNSFILSRAESSDERREACGPASTHDLTRVGELLSCFCCLESVGSRFASVRSSCQLTLAAGYVQSNI